MSELFTIEAENPHGENDERFERLTLEEAAARMDDLTSVGADVILADWDEDCDNCKGVGSILDTGNPETYWPNYESDTCPVCHGNGKRSEPWERTDDETGLRVTMRREED